jgi:hypothetical protein
MGGNIGFLKSPVRPSFWPQWDLDNWDLDNRDLDNKDKL